MWEYVGCYRFTTREERDALAAVYRSRCPSVRCPLRNYFMPAMKLVDKTQGLPDTEDRSVQGRYKQAGEYGL
ncbi:MAG: hypothetical protein LBQ88_12345 [Treponema sp.]|nr:hypothetical protein [Treponema sp.]